METPETDQSSRIKWFSVKEAAEYLDVGEPTLYRWIRDGKITYRKVGETTRFLREDLEGMVEVFHRVKDAEVVRDACPACRSTDLVDGRVQGTGLTYFHPAKTKFWTLSDSYLETKARMCARCGTIVWYADTVKLAALRLPAPPRPAEPVPPASEPPPTSTKPTI